MKTEDLWDYTRTQNTKEDHLTGDLKEGTITKNLNLKNPNGGPNNMDPKQVSE